MLIIYHTNSIGLHSDRTCHLHMCAHSHFCVCLRWVCARAVVCVCEKERVHALGCVCVCNCAQIRALLYDCAPPAQVAFGFNGGSLRGMWQSARCAWRSSQHVCAQRSRQSLRAIFSTRAVFLRKTAVHQVRRKSSGSFTLPRGSK